MQLRVIVSFTDGGGTVEQVISSATGPTGANWDGVLGAAFGGTAGNDIADGGILGETINGHAGADDLDGGGGNDIITGGAGNDLVTGGAGTDVASFVGPLSNFSFSTGTANTNITVTDNTGAEGVDTVSGIETLRFNGVNYTVVNGSQATTTPSTAVPAPRRSSASTARMSSTAAPAMTSSTAATATTRIVQPVPTAAT